jgi:hypothetical protein
MDIVTLKPLTHFCTIASTVDSLAKNFIPDHRNIEFIGCAT